MCVCIYLYIFIYLYTWCDRSVQFREEGGEGGGREGVKFVSSWEAVQVKGSDSGLGASIVVAVCRQARWRSMRIWKVHKFYALPSSTLTAWGLMAPVRAGLLCPPTEEEEEGSGSWSLLVRPPDGALPSPNALRTSRIVLLFMPSSGPFTGGSGAEGGVEWERSRPGFG